MHALETCAHKYLASIFFATLKALELYNLESKKRHREIGNTDVFLVIYNVQSKIYNLQSVIDNLQSTVCNLQCAIYNLRSYLE